MNRTLNMKTKKIAIGSDHAGFESKENAKSELLGLGLEVVDKGTNSLASVDYPLGVRSYPAKSSAGF